MAPAACHSGYARTRTVRVRNTGFCPLNHMSGCFIITCFVLPAPGAVGHLSFTDILDTSLKVSWKEPQEKNGILTGSDFHVGD